MSGTPRGGFTLVELVIATLLAGIVMAALSAILVPLVLSQAYSAGAQGVQLNLAAADQLVERQLRQASLVTQPALAGVASATLEGCANAALSHTPPSPAPIDPTAPMTWFAFCAAGGLVYYHAGSGCPASYSCGAAPAAVFAWGPSPQASLAFVRPSAGSTLITADLKAASGGASAETTSAVAFSAPAGGAQ